MAKLKNYVFSLLTSLFFLSANQAESKQITKTLDFDSINNLDKIELISNPQPLVLKQADFNSDYMFVGHRSHSSHRSHASHRSHYSHRSGYSRPSSPPSAPVVIPPSTSSKPSSREWSATAEWQKNLNRLYYHEVIVTLKDNRVYRGLVTDCKDNAIEIQISKLESGRAAVWIDVKNIRALLWR